MSGKGLHFYLDGVGDNRICVGAVDSDGDVVDSIDSEGEDVSMSLCAEARGASVTRVHVTEDEPGVVEVVYHVGEC